VLRQRVGQPQCHLEPVGHRHVAGPLDEALAGTVALGKDGKLGQSVSAELVERGPPASWTRATPAAPGGATRPLPQLPITVNEEGWFVARGDFPEPVGPAFWEYRTH
jgi:hypothetical protein